MKAADFNRRGDWARGCAVAVGATLPFSTFLDNILLALMVLLWLAAAGRETWIARWSQLKSNPIAWLFAAYIALCTAGLTWSAAGLGEAWEYYERDLGFAGSLVLLTLFGDARWRRRALVTWCAAIAALVAGSLLVRLGLPLGWLGVRGTPDNPIVVRTWITHGLLTAAGAYVFLLLAADRGLHLAPRLRRACYALAALAAFNTVFMIEGRTGQVLLAVLILYWGYAQWRLRGATLAALGLAGVLALAWLLPSALHQRTALAVEEYHASAADTAASQHSSVGLRMEYYRNTLALIREHPLAGAGTGGFRAAYAQAVGGSAMEPTDNPHELYLFLMAEFGVFGVIMLGALLALPWRAAARLPTDFERHAARGLVLLLGVGGLFNTLLIDHTERLLLVWGLGVLFAAYAPAALSPSAHAARARQPA